MQNMQGSAPLSYACQSGLRKEIGLVCVIFLEKRNHVTGVGVLRFSLIRH